MYNYDDQNSYVVYLCAFNATYIILSDTSIKKLYIHVEPHDIKHILKLLI